MVAVLGPTAVGKTALAVDLAEAIGGEVVSTDAYAVYRGMDIGTAKPTAAELSRVRHHCVDVYSIHEPVTVAAFQRIAREAVASCQQRSVPVVLTGGSALYVRAVLDHFDFPGWDPAVRRRLQDELADEGASVLHARLRAVDPVAAEQILPSNGRRIVRALEVIEITGEPFRASLPAFEYVYPQTVQIGLRLPREPLDQRIAERVNRMWRAGFVEEVRALDRAGLRETPTAVRALGYPQVLRFLDGECTEQDALDETVRATRRFARRQMSWFRRDPRVQWLDADAPNLLAAALPLVREPVPG